MADGKDAGQQDRGRGFEELDEVLTRLRDNGREFMEAASSRIAELRKRDVQELGNQFTAQAREMFESAVNMLQMVPDIINRLGARGEEADEEAPSAAQEKAKPEQPEAEPTAKTAEKPAEKATKANKATKAKKAGSTEKSATSSKSVKKVGSSPEKAEKPTKKAGTRASKSGEPSG